MSVTSINYAGNGNFQMTVNGQQKTLNLADLNTMLRMEQISSYDQTIADQLSAIQQTNQRRNALNQLLRLMRSQKAQSKNGTGSDASAAAKPVASAPGSELPSPTAERPSDKDAQYGKDVGVFECPWRLSPNTGGSRQAGGQRTGRSPETIRRTAKAPWYEAIQR